MRKYPFFLPVGTFALVAAASPAGSPFSWPELVARPLSPGSIALLVEHAAEPQVLARWSAALRDPRPDVRAATARVANVTAATSLLSDLLAAVADETDQDAATEEAHAIAALGGAIQGQELGAVARRRPEVAAAIAMGVARGHGAAALAQLPVFRAALNTRDLYRFLSAATWGGREALVPAGSSALRGDGDAEAWNIILELAREGGITLDESLLVTALRARSAALRQSTYWHLVLRPETPSGVIARAVDETPEALAQPASPGARLAYEMLRRRQGQAPRHDRETVAALLDTGEAGPPFALLYDREALKRLTEAELAALSRASSGDDRRLAAQLRSEDDEQSRSERKMPSTRGDRLQRRVTMRTPDGLPRGFVSDVMAVSGCAPGDADAFHGAQVSFGMDGRPRTVTMLSGLPEVRRGCLEATKAIIMSAIALTDRFTTPGGEPAMTILPLHPEFLACLAETPIAAPNASPRPTRIMGPIEEPKKVRNVRPTYPGRAREARIQGIVILEAVIAPSGCVHSVDVLRSVHPQLDVAAMMAVSRWKYTPTLLDGRPVPVIMTVTVNFRLS